MTDTARLDQLAGERLDLLASIEKTKQRLADVDALLTYELGEVEGGRHELTYAPGQGVKLVAPSKRFNADLARAVLSPAQYSSVCVPTPNATLARQLLPGAVVDMCCKAAGDYRIGNL